MEQFAFRVCSVRSTAQATMPPMKKVRKAVPPAKTSGIPEQF